MSKKKEKEIEQVKAQVAQEETVETEETEAETPVETDELSELKAEVDRLKDQLLRNQAELQNFKRRTNDERIKDRKYATLDLMKKLLTPIDNFEIAVNSKSEDKTIAPYVKGFEMIRRDLLETLNEEGLKEIDALNQPFDPHLHQAVTKEKLEGVDSNNVIEVYQKGYMYKDRLIRPAMVKVSE